MMATNVNFRRFSFAWALQLVGTALLLWVGYSWLTWPDEKTWQVVASMVVALIVFIAAVWMERTVFASFYSFEDALRPKAGPVVAFAFWAGVLIAVECLLAAFYSTVERVAVRLAQISHLPPRVVTATMEWGTWITMWVVVPAILLPFASKAARQGFGGGRSTGPALSLLKMPRYWILLLLTLLVGAYLPYRLVHWIPDQKSLKAEMWSAGLRLSIAYLLAVTAFVSLAWGIVKTFRFQEKAEIS